MRGVAVVLGALITLTISGGAVAAMSADLRQVVTQAQAREMAAHQTVDPVWFGGDLAPIIVEAAPAARSREVVRQAPRVRVAPRVGVVRIG